jgi:hypothetical protein
VRYSNSSRAGESLARVRERWSTRLKRSWEYEDPQPRPICTRSCQQGWLIVQSIESQRSGPLPGLTETDRPHFRHHPRIWSEAKRLTFKDYVKEGTCDEQALAVRRK